MAINTKIKRIYHDNTNIWYELYYSNGKMHRENGPAYIKYYQNGTIENEIYYLNGLWHRENGPAYISYNKNGNINYEQYWFNDKNVTIQIENLYKIIEDKSLDNDNAKILYKLTYNNDILNEIINIFNTLIK